MANELKPYVNKVDTNTAFAQALEEAVRRALPDGGDALFDGQNDVNIADFFGFMTGMIASITTRGVGDDILILVVSGSVTIFKGSTNATFSSMSAAIDNKEEDLEEFKFEVTVDESKYTGDDLKSTTVMNQGTGYIKEKLVTQSVMYKRYNNRNFKNKQINNCLYVGMKEVA